MIGCHKLSVFFSQELVMKCQDQAKIDRIQANVEKVGNHCKTRVFKINHII